MLEIFAGAVSAGVLVVALHRAGVERVQRYWAWLLFVAAAIYVGFVLVGNVPIQWLLIEIGGLVLFSALAVVGLKYSPWVLAAAWFGHIGWDTLLHSPDMAFVPTWYPPLCIGFDLVVGAYIVFVCSRPPKRVAPKTL
jgi:hypothetical protein